MLRANPLLPAPATAINSRFKVACAVLSVSRFYMSGACLNTRKNDFNSLPDCSKDGGSVSDATLATCERVFNSSARACPRYALHAR